MTRFSAYAAQSMYSDTRSLRTVQATYFASSEYLLVELFLDYTAVERSDRSDAVLYDVIERQRLEARIIERITALVDRCPADLRAYFRIPIVRRVSRSRPPLHVVVTTMRRGWFVTADGFYTQYDTRWLAKLDMSELRDCLRFLTTGKDLSRGWHIDLAVHRATELKQQCEMAPW